MVSLLRPSVWTILLLLTGAITAVTANADSAVLKDTLTRLEEGPARLASAKNALDAIRAFYSQRDYRPFWLEESRLSPRAKALLHALANAGDHGLNPDTYGAQALAERASKIEPASMAELELALTHAYLSYAGDVSSGVIDNPRKIGGTTRNGMPIPAAKWLEDIASSNDVAGFLDRLPPNTRGYRQLKAALAIYREIENGGGWPAVDKGLTLKPGAKGARVAQAKRRLIATGELDAIGDAEIFDGDLVIAVKKFQLRHGLKDDGNIGAETVTTMNVPVAVRIEQIIINLERQRWLGVDPGDRYVFVNVADNHLNIIENDRIVYSARGIVGKPIHETPVFSAPMTYIEVIPIGTCLTVSRSTNCCRRSRRIGATWALVAICS